MQGQQWVKSIMILKIFAHSYFDLQLRLKMTTMSWCWFWDWQTKLLELLIRARKNTLKLSQGTLHFYISLEYHSNDIVFKINLWFVFSSSSSPLSESNDILVGIDQSEADPQTRRLQELGCDLDLLGIDDPIVEPNPTQKMNESTNSKQAAIDDLQQLNNVFMQNQFGYQPTQR